MFHFFNGIFICLGNLGLILFRFGHNTIERRVKRLAYRDEYLKFMTERVLQFIETPLDERRKAKIFKKSQQELWFTQWFGVVPFSMKIMITKCYRASKVIWQRIHYRNK
jgi:hypothetical protein